MTSHALANAAQLVRQRRDPLHLITIDHSLVEVMLLHALTHAGYTGSRWSQVLEWIEPNVIRTAGGTRRVLDAASTTLFLDLHNNRLRSGL